MRRKDCDNQVSSDRRSKIRPCGRVLVWSVAVLMGGLSTTKTLAGTVRLWPSAVVVTEQVRLTDLCELNGFKPEVERQLLELVITSAPPAGGTRVIHIEMIRSALAGSSVNMAELTLRGATRCALSRPSEIQSAESADPTMEPERGDPVRLVSAEAKASSRVARKSADPSTGSAHRTLKQAVVDYFNREFLRYGGTADVTFGRASEAVLDLTMPPYEFHVRRRRGSPLGITPLDVEVLSNDRIVQSVPLVVQVSMVRPVVVARRAIGQDATVRSSDLSVDSMSFARLDRIGLDDVSLVVGQRAKRFIPTGSLIEPEMLEAVPLVKRGELVTLVSVVGGVRVVTTAKATENGRFGDVVRVRSLNRQGVAFDAVVVGPGEVQIGNAVPRQRPAALALGGTG